MALHGITITFKNGSLNININNNKMEKVIPIQKSKAFIAFNNATPEGKKLLTDLLGPENVSGDITDLVKTFEDAEALDTGWTAEDEAYLQNVKKATIITRVLNAGWKANYDDDKQPKYYVWMVYDKAASAFRFFGTYDVYTGAYSATVSRHVFKDAKTARYFVEQFNTLVNKILL